MRCNVTQFFNREEYKNYNRTGTPCFKWWKGYTRDFLNRINSLDTDAPEENNTSEGDPSTISIDYHLYMFLQILFCIVGLSVLITIVYYIIVYYKPKRRTQRRPLEYLRAARLYSYEHPYVPDPTSQFSKHKHKTGSLPSNPVAIAMNPEMDRSVDGSAHSSDGSSGHYVYIQSLRNPYSSVPENNSP